MTDSILDKWLAILSKFESHPDLINWLKNHHNTFGDASPLTYNKLGMCLACISACILTCIFY
jgi:hypothetical protein